MIIVAAIVFVAIAAGAIMASLRVDQRSRMGADFAERIVRSDVAAATRSASGALHARQQLVR